MGSKVGQRLTLLGLCALIFYGYMLASGRLTLEIMPQFLVAAVIFLSSGRIMRRAAQLMGSAAEEEQDAKRPRAELDWPWLTALLNWTCAFLVVGIMALLLLKPIDLTWSEAISRAAGPTHFFAGAVP